VVAATHHQNFACKMQPSLKYSKLECRHANTDTWHGTPCKANSIVVHKKQQNLSKCILHVFNMYQDKCSCCIGYMPWSDCNIVKLYHCILSVQTCLAEASLSSSFLLKKNTCLVVSICYRETKLRILHLCSSFKLPISFSNSACGT